LPAKPRRSALFLFVTAEEGGLKGSEYYAQHPLIPAAKDRHRSQLRRRPAVGPRQTDLDRRRGTHRRAALAENVAKRLKLEIQPDAEPGQGHTSAPIISRSRAPAFPPFRSTLGTEFEGKPAGYGMRMWEEYNRLALSPPLRRISRKLDFTSDAQAAEFGFILGSDIANQDKLPDWRPGDQFSEAVRASGECSQPNTLSRNGQWARTGPCRGRHGTRNPVSYCDYGGAGAFACQPLISAEKAFPSKF